MGVRGRRSLSLAIMKAVILAWIVMTAACTKESYVKRGELFATSNSEYDAFFAAVYRITTARPQQRETKDSVRRPLEGYLNQPPSVPDSELLSSLQKRLTEAGRAPGSWSLETKGDDAKIVTKATVKLALREGVTAIELSGGAAWRRVRGTAQSLDDVRTLLRKAAELDEQVSSAFASISKQADVTTELAASRDVLREMESELATVAREADTFLAELRRAVSGPAPTRGPSAKGKGKGGVASDGSSPGASSPSTAPASAPSAEPSPPKAPPPEEVFSP